ncbi:MerR family transcriptional regulator [Mycolicibacterium sp.]|uniref:MerR family transcriptional regulator n=1 Tax=Mycolicibacterium sp. TaxID=2320850 RepID=UPI0037C6A92A
MQIGQVAARTELSIRTVRHYDDVGLVIPSVRSTGGFRLYTDADVDRLMLARKMRSLGFTLSEMKDLLAVLDAVDDTKSAATHGEMLKQRLRGYRTKVDENAARLRAQLADAEELVALLSTRAEANVHAGRSRALRSRYAGQSTMHSSYRAD